MTKLNLLQELISQVGDCTKCGLHKNRKNIVFGRGSADAKVMFVGDFPGQWEDAESKPFVGRKGTLLENAIRGLGLEDADVYMTYALKCTVPGSKPGLDHIEACAKHLFKQIITIEPKIIIPLGRFASQQILETSEPMSKLRGLWHKIYPLPWLTVDVMPTFHPAFVLKNAEAKIGFVTDLKKVKRNLENGTNPQIAGA